MLPRRGMSMRLLRRLAESRLLQFVSLVVLKAFHGRPASAHLHLVVDLHASGASTSNRHCQAPGPVKEIKSKCGLDGNESIFHITVVSVIDGLSTTFLDPETLHARVLHRHPMLAAVLRAIDDPSEVVSVCVSFN